MQNPFSVSLNAAAMTVSDIVDSRVDRDQELSTSSYALLAQHHNVLLYGELGIGKTFITKLLQHEIERSHSSVFPILVSASGLMAYHAAARVPAFPHAVLLQICSAIWKQLIGKSYLDLRERLTETGEEITLRKRPEKTIQRIYTSLMLTASKLRYEMNNLVGFSAGAKGEKSETAIREAEKSEILPFEFLEFIEEINSSVLPAFQKERIVVLCDEANLLPHFNQYEILERFLELFRTRYVQFFFVAGRLFPDEIFSIPSCFETVLELKGFSTADDVRALIAKMDKQRSVAFADDAIDVLFEEFQGHPRKTVAVCADAFDLAIEKKSCAVTESIVSQACRQARRREAQYQRMLGTMRQPSNAT